MYLFIPYKQQDWKKKNKKKKLSDMQWYFGSSKCYLTKSMTNSIFPVFLTLVLLNKLRYHAHF